MGKRYVYPSKVGRYYARRRVLEGKQGTLLPYTTGTFLKPAIGPRGGKAYRECYRQTWWCEGRVCRIANVRHEHEDGTVSWTREFQPITNEVYNRYDTSEPHYRLYEGVLMTTLAVGVNGFGNLY